MSLGWCLNEPLALLLGPKLMTCLQELGDIREGGQCTQRMEAAQVETEEETVVVVPPEEEEEHGVVEDTREVEAQAQRLVLMLAVMGPESFGHGHCAGVLDLNFKETQKHVSLFVTACPERTEESEAAARREHSWFSLVSGFLFTRDYTQSWSLILALHILAPAAPSAFSPYTQLWDCGRGCHETPISHEPSTHCSSAPPGHTLSSALPGFRALRRN